MTLRERAHALKREAVTLYFAVRDPRTPLPAKIVAGLVLAYALSPAFVLIIGTTIPCAPESILNPRPIRAAKF